MATILSRLPRPDTDAAHHLDGLLATIAETPSPFHRLPPATYHPSRDPNYLTEGAEIAAVARILDRHLQPWQRKAADVATEYIQGPNGQRLYHYHTVIIIVPRQSGKTDLTHPVQLHRALTFPAPAACWYTAQSGQDARQRILEFLERIDNTLAAALATTGRSNGAEGVRIRDRAGSHITRFSPTYSALHGEHPPLVTLDEIWRYPKDLGDALLGAIEPAQITLGRRAQIWLISTQGTHASEWLLEQIERGRSGEDPGVCYIEYSLGDGLDPLDPASWWTFHPALGNTIQEEDLARRAARAATNDSARATFLRAYCNRLVAADGEGLIDLAAWDDCAAHTTAVEKDQLTLSYEVAPGGAMSAVVAAWTDPATNRAAIRIVRQDLGTRWLRPFLRNLAAEWGCRIAADGAGPAALTTADLATDGIDIRTLTLPEFAQATESILAHIANTTLAHDDNPDLRDQAASARARTTNGTRRFSRDSPRPIPALIAAAVALYVHEHPAPTDAPLILL